MEQNEEGMKVLFLDIDGVLNNDDVLEKAADLRNSRHEIRANPRWDEYYTDMLSTELISKLNSVKEQTGCMVVCSSSWRWELNRHELEFVLQLKGYDGILLGCTIKTQDGYRGEEIKEWIDTAKEKIHSIAIVDDISDGMLHMKPWLVQTSVKSGMTDATVESLVSLLNDVPFEFSSAPQ